MVRLTKRGFYATITAGVTVAILIVAGSFIYSQLSQVPAGSVTLNGVFVNVTYVPGSMQPWAPSTSNCTDREFGLPSYHCPVKLSGGTEFSVLAFLSVPSNETAFLNDTVWSPVPFQELSCSGTGSCPLTNHWEDRNWTVTSGRQWGDVVMLAIPSPAPSFPDGFWVVANVTVNVVSG